MHANGEGRAGQLLLSAIPTPDPRIEADEPAKSGCPFRTRCPIVKARCAEEVPPLRETGTDHYVACHLA